jgi:CPA1 family monovalent cation:H+ antiporter
MELFYIFSLLITLSALFGYLNQKFIKLPGSIGLMFISLLMAVGISIAGKFNPEIQKLFEGILQKFDFSTILLDFMLSFMLFAGAFHIHFDDLKEAKLPVILFSTLSVLISTAIIGYLMFFLLKAFDIQMDLIYCFLFGSLISPTDPIAVISILKKAGIPKSLETKIAGESLFNDGVAVVIFLVLFKLADSGDAVNIPDALELFGVEAGGGLALGLILGYLGYKLIKSIDHYQTEVLVTLAVVMGGYTIALLTHVSGPLAMVVAGLILGNPAKEKGMSVITADYVDKFWELIDEIMNGILFVFIGLQFIEVNYTPRIEIIAAIAVLVNLLARFVSIWIPAQIIRWKEPITLNTIKVLTWGGLRGGISIALALSLKPEFGRDIWLSFTYVIACFSIFVQGLTVSKMKYH